MLGEDCEKPNPKASITTLEIIEKHGLEGITLRVWDAVHNNQNITTTLSLRTANGTGSATFEDGTTSKNFSGNINNQLIKIKGVTESSQLNNLIVEAKYGGSVLDDEDFTVAAITSLTFERYSDTYLEPDTNPGNGVNGSAGGTRIYPDKLTPAEALDTNSPDRSLIRVNAQVSPAAANLNVYFGSFDLDDPSANATPIDPNGSKGQDNNGHASFSKSGDFVVPSPAPSGVTCDSTTAGHTTGTAPNHISKIVCTTASDGKATAVFKTTMQPGDNFGVAASVNREYLNGFRVNDLNGSQIYTPLGGAVVTESGAANPNNVPGLRTEMLTVWRKLHIEVDSMGLVSGNSVSGTLLDTRRVGRGDVTLNLFPDTTLENNRFENGRLIIYPGTSQEKSLSIIDATATSTANTGNSVTINNTGLIFQVTSGDPFIIYDDDDMDDNDGTLLLGDTLDDVPEPDLGLLQSSAVSCAEIYTTNNCNMLLPAYVLPIVQVDDSHDETDVFLNAGEDNILSIRISDYQRRSLESNSFFWSIYLLGGYQALSGDDGDPGTEGSLLGLTDGIAANDGEGSVIFQEVNRSIEYTSPNWNTRPVGRRFTITHEVGHLFGGHHTQDYTPGTSDAGLMAQSYIRNGAMFTTVTINKIRGGTGITHP